MEAIQTKNLSKSFGTKQAVKGMNLTIEEGELFSLLGVNGAGKTTTIRMLTGLSKPTNGDAWVCQKSIVSELDEVKKMINLSPQETAVAGNLSVRENLMLMAQIYGFSKEESIKKVEQVVDEFDLSEVIDTKCKTLSGGWQRKISIAMAIITDPKVLFLDEPTLGLDVIARRELWRVITQLRKKMTIILTTHYMEEAEALSDRIAIMVKGEIKEIGTMQQLKDITGEDTLENCFIKIVEGGKEFINEK